MLVMEKAPAKINLSLDVLNKREDGYHDVEMVMTTIDLADRLEFRELSADKIQLSLESRYVPSDERNLAYKAAALFKETYKINKGVHIRIDKSIPVSAGLAGGSADAAAVLRGLNRLWQMDISLTELADLGAQLGADIAFCVYSKTAIAKGYGELIEFLPAPPACWVVIARPDIGVSSYTVFDQINLPELEHPDTKEVLEALNEGNFSKLCNHLGNALEPITFSMHPEVAKLKEAMRLAGAEGVMMSGSGPTVFGLMKHHRKALRIYNSMRGFCKDVQLIRMLG
ncbi:4-(cytidine 5'-diphospho)-2-C-methyl-D-erythritol kinase [Oceanobacillus timonensis]|uniref:4-(cytidine 5'-diphospho)-2-C-methyl-D-erythritol kinase n=1 Tax=Oceanobacillus timonensis TaxID=1926285 RepID=UPI0009BBD412|nr:4-(cytidine 5'-diphospho)-2-C-methyl-D-erythritol kinase [Oceanobacillus timonensis]